MRISILDCCVYLGRLHVSVRRRSLVSAVVGMRSHHDWHAFAMSGDGIDGVKARKCWSSLLLSEEVLEGTINQHIGCVFDSQARLTTARVDGQVLKFAHVHVDVDMMMRSGEDGRTKAVETAIEHCCYEKEGTCLVNVGCWCNGSIGQKGTDKISTKPTKYQKTAAQQM